MKAVDLSVITVTWNAADLITAQIASVRTGCEQTSYEQIVCDNGSSDATCDVVEQESPHVRLLRNQKNLGFSAANNRALEHASGEFVLFLNPDMRVSRGSLDTIVTWMRQHEDVGLASCKLVDEHDVLHPDAQPRRFPKAWEMIALILKLPHVFPKLLDGYMMRGFDADVEQDVDSARGSFMIVRKKILDELSFGFDPRYFIWFEDVDLCREIQRLGYRVVHTPVISCVDYVGQSFKKRDTLWKQRNFTKSMLTYFQKWEPWYVWMWIALLRPFGIVLAYVNDMIHNKKG